MLGGVVTTQSYKLLDFTLLAKVTGMPNGEGSSQQGSWVSELCVNFRTGRFLV
jgi:hypothetical protein